MEMKKLKEKLPVIFSFDNREPLDSLSRKEIIEGYHGGTSVKVYGSREHFSVFVNVLRATVMGSRVFYKSRLTHQFTYKDKRVYGDLSNEVVNWICKAFNINWLTDINWCRNLVAGDKRLFRMVLNESITNPEQLCKKYSKLYFGGKYSYANLKQVFAHDDYKIDLWRIYYYSTNPDLLLSRMLSSELETSLVRDMLILCSYENLKINSTWSQRRIKEEHQKLVEKSSLEEADRYSNENITEPFKDDTFETIMNEKQMFIEGVTMHNCVHSCYWCLVSRGTYLVITGKPCGTKVDIGIYYNPETKELTLDQIKKRFNGGVSDLITVICTNWIKANSQKLKETAASVYKKNGMNRPF